MRCHKEAKPVIKSIGSFKDLVNLIVIAFG